MSKLHTQCAVVLLLLVVATTVWAAPGTQAFDAGRQALAANDIDKAIASFEQAVKVEPGRAEYHYWLGSAYGRAAARGNMLKAAGLAKKSREAMEKSVQLNPEFIDARLGLIEFYMMAPAFMGGGRDKALAQVAEVRKRDALQGHRAMSRVHSLDKKPELAHQELLAGIKEQPNSAKAHHYYAIQLMLDKNYKGAFDEFEKSVNLDAAYMPSVFRVGQTSAMGNYNLGRGEEALKKYLTYKPADDEPPLARAWYWLGTIYEKQGKKADARASYAKSLQLAPGVKDVQEAAKRVGA